MAGTAIAWASSDPMVAAVDASGLVTAVGNGAATITASAGSASGSAQVTVAQEVGAVGVTPANDTLVAFGDTLRLLAEAFDANGHAVVGALFTWASSDAGVAVVDTTGLVRGEAAGEAEITATAGSASGSARLVVIAAEPTTVRITPDSVALTALGDTVRLQADVRDQLGRPITGAATTWASSDPSVAMVDSAGLVRAVGNGKATVTARAGAGSTAAEVTVTQLVASVAVTPSSERVAVGLTLQLSAEAFDAGGSAVLNATFSWRSSDETVATVDSTGLVLGVTAGTAVITAASGDAEGAAQIGVGRIPPIVMEVGARMSLDLSAHFGDPGGKTVRYSARWPVFAAGVPLTVTGALVDGMATIWAVDDGEADIVFTATDGSGSVSQEVHVTTTPPAVPTGTPSLRVIYAIPSDKEWRQPYSDAVQLAIEAIQGWYLHQLDGRTFAIHAGIPEPCHLTEPEAWFKEHPASDWRNNAWARLRKAIQACAPVGEGFDQDHNWLVYADILEECDPVHGTALGRGWNGLTMIGGQDLRALTDSTYVVGPHCYGGSFGRWFGGLAHELGHGFNLLHPPGCNDGLPTCDRRALMWVGMYSWPDTYLRAEDEIPHLLANRFIREP